MISGFGEHGRVDIEPYVVRNYLRFFRLFATSFATGDLRTDTSSQDQSARLRN